MDKKCYHPNVYWKSERIEKKYAVLSGVCVDCKKEVKKVLTHGQHQSGIIKTKPIYNL